MNAVDVADRMVKELERADVLAQLDKAAADGLDVRRLIANARAEVAANEYLAKCAPASILRAVQSAARAGVQLGTHGEAYLVPFKGQCVLVTGYRGMIRILYDGGAVTAIESHLVRQGDAWEYEITPAGPRFRHVPDCFGDPNRPALGAYAYARLSSGETLLEAMSAKEIDAIRARSAGVKSGKATPWDTDPGEMARKTVLRRLAKRCPMSDRSRARFAAAEEEALIIEGVTDVPQRASYADVLQSAAAAHSAAPEAEAAPMLPESATDALLGLVDAPDAVADAVRAKGEEWAQRRFDSVLAIERNEDAVAYLQRELAL